MLLGKDNALKKVDLGLVHSSAAIDMPTLVLNRLRQDGDLETGISPSFLVRNWPAMKEWPTKSVRDAFYASPKFPRLLSPDLIRHTIARGVENGLLAYVGKNARGEYKPFHFNDALPTALIFTPDTIAYYTSGNDLGPYAADSIFFGTQPGALREDFFDGGFDTLGAHATSEGSGWPGTLTVTDNPTPVPEPGTLVLLPTGLCALWARLRRVRGIK